MVQVVNVFKMIEKDLDIIYRYYPKDKYPSDPEINKTKEAIRYWKNLELYQMNKGNFPDLITRVEKIIPQSTIDDYSLRGAFDPSFKARVFFAENLNDYKGLVISVSTIAFYYDIYLSKYVYPPETSAGKMLDDRLQETVNIIGREIEELFPGYRQVPSDYRIRSVPAVYAGYNQLATMYQCLISDDIL